MWRAHIFKVNMWRFITTSTLIHITSSPTVRSARSRERTSDRRHNRAHSYRSRQRARSRITCRSRSRSYYRSRRSPSRANSNKHLSRRHHDFSKKCKSHRSRKSRSRHGRSKHEETLFVTRFVFFIYHSIVGVIIRISYPKVTETSHIPKWAKTCRIYDFNRLLCPVRALISVLIRPSLFVVRGIYFYFCQRKWWYFQTINLEMD